MVSQFGGPGAGFSLPPALSLDLVRQAARPGGGGGKAVALAKKGAPWSDDEHKAFLAGLKMYGRGQWKQISRYYVPSRTPTQVASHAQKHFLRQSGAQKRRSRFAAVEEAAAAAVAAAPMQLHSPASAAPVPGAPALPSFFAHSLPAGQHAPALPRMLPAAPSSGLALPQPGAIVGGIALGVPIGVLPPLPSITTSTGTELPILPVMPGRINAMAAMPGLPAGAPAAAATPAHTTLSADSAASEGLQQASGAASAAAAATAVSLPLLTELPLLPLHSHSRGAPAGGAVSAGLGPAAALLPVPVPAPAPAPAAHYTPPTGRTKQLLRLLELNEQQQLAAGAAADGASSGSAPTLHHHASQQQQQQSPVRRVPSATAALDTLASLAEAEAQSFEAAAAVGQEQQAEPFATPAHGGCTPLVSAF